MERWQNRIYLIIRKLGPLKSSEVHDYLQERMFYGEYPISISTTRRYMNHMAKDHRITYLQEMKRWYADEAPQVQPSCCSDKKPPLFWILFAALAVTITAVIIAKFYA